MRKQRIFGAILSVTFVIALPGRAQIGNFASLAKEIADLVAGSPGQSKLPYFLGKYSLEILPEISVNMDTDVAGKNLREALAELKSDSETKNLAGHIERLEDLSRETKRLVRQVSVAEFSPKEYNFESQAMFCAQSESIDYEIASMEQLSADLVLLSQKAGSAKNALDPIGKITHVLDDFWSRVNDNAVGSLVLNAGASFQGYDGSFLQQYYIWACPGDTSPYGVRAGGGLETCAKDRIDIAHENWDEIERVSREKNVSLQKKITAAKAFRTHYFSAAVEKCDGHEVARDELDAILDSVLAEVDDESGALRNKGVAASRGLIAAADRSISGMQAGDGATHDSSESVAAAQGAFQSTLNDALQANAQASKGAVGNGPKCEPVPEFCSKEEYALSGACMGPVFRNADNHCQP